MNECIKYIKNRRSINYFDSEKKIDRNLLNELLELANLSPSSINLQPWEVIIVEKDENKKLLRECAFNQPKVEEASAVLIIIANPKAVEENIDRVLNNWVKIGNITSDKIDIYKNTAKKLYSDDYKSYKRSIFSVKNTSFFAMSIMISARFLGLETHPMDGFDEAKIKDTFNIDNYKIIPLLIAIGYPAKNIKLNKRGERRKLVEFVRYL
ncbi:MAG: nitroreductase family protein [Deferribacterota bacterium]|nr:nitroreductase family protein [Deferribacterota bacterium]